MDTNYDTQNMHKFLFLANEFPGKKIDHVINLFQLPLIEVNNTIERLSEEGYLHIDSKTNRYDVLKVPEVWVFGDGVQRISEGVLYAMNTYADRWGRDVEENYFGGWLTGYASHDVMVAVHQLLNENKLAKYVLESKSEGKYLFYCLPQHIDEERGRKQFKKPQKVTRVSSITVDGEDKAESVAVRVK